MVWALVLLGSHHSSPSAIDAASMPSPATAPPWETPLAIGQWYELPSTSLASVAPSPVPPGNTGPSSKVDAWTSFALDPRDSKVYSVAGGGHDDYGGNEVDMLALETATPAWTQTLAPTPNAMCSSYYAGGQLTQCSPELIRIVRSRSDSDLVEAWQSLIRSS